MNVFPLIALSISLLARATSAAEIVSLLDSPSRLGIAEQPEWSEFADRSLVAARLDLDFKASANPDSERCLVVRHGGVKLRWQVQLNGKTIASLPTLEQRQSTSLAIPPGSLMDGVNRLAIVGPNSPDDIVIESIRVIDAPVSAALGESRLEVRVTDAATGGPLPCRITVVGPEGALVPLRAEPAGRLAVREGVVYTGDGTARISTMAGEYTVWASRGFEWSAVSKKITIAGGQTETVRLALTHEVPTPGWISVDSHIHTLTHSGHGDSSIDERMLTIAGEGIDLAVATDHNHHTDYTAAAEKTGVTKRFAHVIGNEVTTKYGHFNAFPILPGSPVADDKIEDWDRLVPAIRATPGVRVVILNHPRNLHSGFVPMGPTQFDTLTGKHRRASAFRGIDGFEVVTSAAMQSDIRLLFRDWFALLNRGHRISAIGSSDTHDVNRYLLGQARTYVATKDTADLESAWKSFEQGRMLVSMGLLTELSIDDRHRVGDLAPPAGDTIEIAVTVTGPSWTRADRVELYANGTLLEQTTIEHPAGAIEKARLTWKRPSPRHDTYFVAIVTGPGVDAPFCETPRPYQASSREFRPQVIGATNPVWIDGDRDGVFSAPFLTARRLTEQHGTEPAKLIPILAAYDESVAVQAASLCADAGAAAPIVPADAPDFVRRAYAAVWKKAAQ